MLKPPLLGCVDWLAEADGVDIDIEVEVGVEVEVAAVDVGKAPSHTLTWIPCALTAPIVSVPDCGPISVLPLDIVVTAVRVHRPSASVVIAL